MVDGWLNGRSKRVGLSLEDGPTAAFDFASPVGQSTEDLADLLTDLGLGPEAGVGGDFRADPAPDGFTMANIGQLSPNRYRPSSVNWSPLPSASSNMTRGAPPSWSVHMPTELSG